VQRQSKYPFEGLIPLDSPSCGGEQTVKQQKTRMLGERDSREEEYSSSAVVQSSILCTIHAEQQARGKQQPVRTVRFRDSPSRGGNKASNKKNKNAGRA
jgi:hypothetical protein